MESKKRYGFERPVQRLDIHCHLGQDGSIFSPEERMAADRFLGIDRCVILPSPVGVGAASIPGCMDSRQARDTARRWPEHFSWFVNVDPDGTNRTYDALAQAGEEGALGVGEFGAKLPFFDDRMDHLLDCCGKLGLPFLFHISPYGTNAYGVIDEKGLPGLEGALRRHPNTIFLAHSQPFWYELSTYDPALPGAALNGFPFGKVTQEGRAVTLLRTYPNLYADLSALSGLNAVLRDPDYGIRFLGEFSDRLLYGTDLLHTGFVFPLGQMLDYYLLSGQLDAGAYQLICRGNAERLLGLSDHV